MQSKLSKDIISTLCYYDALNYPVTFFEIWKYLTKGMTRDTEGHDGREKFSVNLFDIARELESEELREIVGSRQGFYFLQGREYLVSERIRKNKISFLKLRKLRRIIEILKFIPFVRMILVTGRLSMKTATSKSDWDLLVVLEKGRIWTGRTLVTALVHLIGKRRYGKKVKDRVCLNHFVTTGSLEILDKNLFSANEYMFSIPIFDSKEYYQKFQLKNYWIQKMKPNYYINELGCVKDIKDSNFSRFFRNTFERLVSFQFLENFLRRIETKKIQSNPKTNMKGSFIEASDKALIFLPKPQGPVIFEKYHQTLEEIRIN